ncbi:nicotinate-nucleotide--dimethylbenzimidazole phosphoribosyltransferase [Nocardioides perillae]|uniref:Nicotinate-nucleotide--dimethylbenzimidazole phosphoribosyltransferase n=1 Tax=Nocardioides perillae TaxID=1119534 RepID=A0A7Y9RT31_9ACTN|nr:nicotinate-nucleotide--dimethylbenzimidazole phosphoribosyltransferase [Nocardioides perillae]NYG55825.1 nicotinate-nucleotide--dimethylbenzimidazole phosphoribosyltransferase [Nocardioides perillae]
MLATTTDADHRDPEDALAALRAAVGPGDDGAARDARERQAQLTKPAGALGALEDVSVQLSAIAGSCPPPVPARPAVAVFAGDHGVHAAGVSPWPQEVTAGMVENFRAGGAAVNVLARACGARVVVVDVGVASPVEPGPDVLVRKVRAGTADLSRGPALTREEALAALLVGAQVAADLVAQGHDLLLTGDMGIGNTTPSACLVAALTGVAARTATGRGTGVDDATFARKVGVVERAVARLAPDADPVAVLAEVGGLEHAALAGFVLGGAAAGVPVLLDGVIAGSAALVAVALAPHAAAYLLAGHRSVEPGHTAALRHLGLRPLVDLDLRLGEGSGAALAVPLVRAAALLLGEMATFDGAGVARKQG